MGSDLWMMDMNGERRVEPLIQTRFNERNAEVSPNGRWVAYQSDESGEFQITVRPFPNVNGGRWQVSSNGGTQPVWTRGGAELIYLDRSHSPMSATITEVSGFASSAPMKLFDARPEYVTAALGRSYDVSRDGQRFVFLKTANAQGQPAMTTSKLVVVLNWFEELKRLVPTN